MKELKGSLKLWLPVIGYMAFMWFLSSRPMDAVPFLNIPFLDKVLHVIEYSVFGFLLMRAFFSGDKSDRRYDTFWIVLFVTLVWGIIDEVHQSFVPSREMSFFDVVFDCIGSAIGCLMFSKSPLPYGERDRGNKPQ